MLGYDFFLLVTFFGTLCIVYPPVPREGPRDRLLRELLAEIDVGT